jgi:hypothetical protein
MDKILDALPQIKTRLQYGFGILVVLAYIIINTTQSTPVMPQIFIFSVVPLLISVQFIGRLTPKLQFVILLIVTLASFAFLGTGVALSLFDRTPSFQQVYNGKIFSIERVLNKRYLENVESEIRNAKSYSDYRNIILNIAKSDKSDEFKDGIDASINFYEDFIACVHKWQCWPSKQFDQRIVDFWYTYRPIIEERRVGLWGKHGDDMQMYAEQIRRPLYSSKVVVIDTNSGTTVLMFPEPLERMRS